MKMKIITIGIINVAIALANIKLLISFLINLYSTKENTINGQNPNFKCSQTLSFTAAIAPTGVRYPDNSNRK